MEGWERMRVMREFFGEEKVVLWNAFLRGKIPHPLISFS